MTDLVFMMGQYEARVPTDRQYARNHMWAQATGSVHRFGFTAYAERMLRDVYFLEWSVEPDTPVATGQPIGEIESKKAESELYAPVNGRLVRINEALLYDPSEINKDVYGSGWLFDIEVAAHDLLTPEQYLDHLSAVWETTQRLIQGDRC